MTHCLLSLLQARAIVAVTETGSMSQAAAMLNMTQPVISRAIAAAEEHIGAPIFQRGWSGSEPTVLGATVMQRCTEVVVRIKEAEDDIAATGGKRPNLLAFLKLPHLDIVAAVVRLGSVSLAAAQLGISQPAVSRVIAAVSRYTPQLLFERHRRGMRPTPPSLCLAALKDDLARLLELPDAAAARREPGLVGRLAVGTLAFSSMPELAKTLGDLMDTHPRLKISSIPGNYPLLAQALACGEIDGIVGSLRGETANAGFHETPLFEENFVLIARAGHPCHRRPTTLTELGKETWIVPVPGTPARAFFERIFLTAGLRPAAKISEMLDFRIIEDVVANSNSLALVCYSDRALRQLRPDLRAVDVELAKGRLRMGLTARKSPARNEIIEAFTEIFLRNLACSSPALGGG